MQIKLVAERFAGLCGIPITTSLKLHFESTVRFVIDNYLNDLDINNLEEIIVTDRFVEDVKRFQREHGMKEEVTDNEIGTAFGKTIIAKDTGKFFIFLNADIATYLLSEELLDARYQNDSEAKADGVLKRDFVINLLAHELSHVEYRSTVEVETSLPKHNPFDKNIEEIALIMFDEYYACRRAYEFCTATDRTTVKQTIQQIEIKVLRLVDLFRNRQVSAREFISLFQEWLQMSLNQACYLLGEGSFENDATKLSGCRIQSVLNEINHVFNDLYIRARSSKRVLLPICIRKCILDYYREFGIAFIIGENGVSVE